ncbi:MAG TPA: di-heme oxidoredictase family protein [Candidatus Polarisedimenticolaceae bacterium]|nr:di-heme oxidoredictase family protein [Candidatus Polarisedimenticolaceae bacterium]
MRVARYLPIVLAAVLVWAAPTFVSAQTEAPTGFDNLTNGFLNQTDFDLALATFAEREEIDEGLGPLYNAESCAECHGNPVIGAISQITELRAGHFDGINFINHPGGSLINDRALNAGIQERVLAANEVRTFRTSLNTLGDGFVEAIDSNTLQAISNGQAASARGQLIQVPVLEANNALRAGRFGWKNQHASLISFSADAYLNEMGITSPLQPTENTSNGNSVAAFDEATDPEDNGDDVTAFANFMRSTKAPPRDLALAATFDAQQGDILFNQIGCNTCHVRSITTAPAGTVINQGAFTVPAALGNKIIHPFSDFLLHNVGTGDGIVQNGGQSTRNKLRTPPLWGMRSRGRLMHDGATVNRNEAILRHFGEANPVINNYINLSTNQKNQLITFLNSL